MGRKAIVKTKEPGMARRVYLVQMLQKAKRVSRYREALEEASSLGDEGSLGEDGEERREVERRSPHPLTSDPALRQDEIAKNGDTDDVDDL
jgi:hypothetical protein